MHLCIAFTTVQIPQSSSSPKSKANVDFYFILISYSLFACRLSSGILRMFEIKLLRVNLSHSLWKLTYATYTRQSSRSYFSLMMYIGNFSMKSEKDWWCIGLFKFLTKKLHNVPFFFFTIQQYVCVLTALLGVLIWVIATVILPITLPGQWFTQCVITLELIMGAVPCHWERRDQKEECEINPYI